MKLFSRDYGTLSSGETAHLFTLVNDAGMEVSITDFGGTIVHILSPDRNGQLGDVVLGYDSVASYEKADGYLGALVGRFANRIAHGEFEVDGKIYNGLHINDSGNHLHGGRLGLSYVMWNSEGHVSDDAVSLTLTYHSPDMEEGYPGNMDITVTYTLDNTGALAIHYEAACDKTCPINLTNHVYFNLGGFASGTVLGHTLTLDAESYCRGDDGLVPTGELVPVDGTPFDFRAGKAIGRDFFANDADLRGAGGYDHCFNFTNWKTAKSGTEPVWRGRVVEPVSGRVLDMLTNQPCVQVYSANFLCNSLYPLRGGYAQRKQIGLCLETQMMPDSPHHQGEENFTDCLLHPGEIYDFTTIYRFSAE